MAKTSPSASQPPVWPEPASVLDQERAAGARVAFFDIDGTLEPLGQKGIPASALKALEVLRQRGVKLVVSTGRHLEYAQEIARFFSFDGWLCANGSYCLLDGALIRAEALDERDVRRIVAGAAVGSYAVALTYDHDLAVGVVSSLSTSLPSGWRHSPVMDPLDLDLERPVYQLNIVVGPERDREVLALTPHLKSARWTDRFLDVVPADGGKQAGMEAVLERVGVERAHSLAFGDGGNDIAMLTFAGVGVAMGNASPQVQAQANYVTSRAESDGLIHGLEGLGLLSHVETP